VRSQLVVVAFAVTLFAGCSDNDDGGTADPSSPSSDNTGESGESSESGESYDPELNAEIDAALAEAEAACTG
jgi:hypothetical protein